MTLTRLVPTRSMSSRRQLVLEFIRRHFREVGQSPSHREIAQATGLERQHVGQHLAALSRQGLLTFERGRGRSIALVDRGAMFSDSELELVCVGRGWTVVKPPPPAAALAEAYPVDPIVPDFGLHAIDALKHIE